MSTRTGSPEGLATRTGLGRSQLADEPWEHLEVVLGHAASDPDLSGRSADVVVEERAVEDDDLARPLPEDRPGHVEAAEAWHPVVEDHHVWHRLPIEVQPNHDRRVAGGRLVAHAQALCGHSDQCR